MGVYTIVTDYLIDSPAKKVADESWMLNIKDVDQIVERCKQDQVNGVICGYIDPCQRPYQQICEALDLPCYGTKDQFFYMTDKHAFKKMCVENSVDVIPEYTEEEALSGRADFPLFVKPVDSRGSRGQSVCYTIEQLENAISFSILFIIASYIRLYPKDWFSNPKITGMLMTVALLLSWTSVAVLATLSRMMGKNIGISYFFVSDSNKVLALATGVSAFLFFKNIKIGYNKIINTIAASTFGVLLIHANSNTMRRWLWQDTFNNVGAYESGNAVIHAIISVILIYAVCTVIDICRIKLIEAPLMKKLK